MKLNVQRIGKVFRLEVNLRFINSNSIAGRHHPVNLYIVLSYRKNSMAHKMKFALCTFSKHDDYQQMLQNSSLDGMKPLAHFCQGGFKRKTFIVGFHLHMRSEPGPILEKWLIFMVALIQQVHADRSVVLMHTLLGCWTYLTHSCRSIFYPLAHQTCVVTLVSKEIQPGISQLEEEMQQVI